MLRMRENGKSLADSKNPRGSFIVLFKGLSDRRSGSRVDQFASGRVDGNHLSVQHRA